MRNQLQLSRIEFILYLVIVVLLPVVVMAGKTGAQLNGENLLQPMSDDYVSFIRL